MTSSGSGLDPNPNLGGFTVVGNSGVSAQMMFLGTADTVFMLDSEFITPLSVVKGEKRAHMLITFVAP